MPVSLLALWADQPQAGHCQPSQCPAEVATARGGQQVMGVAAAPGGQRAGVGPTGGRLGQ